MLVITDSDSICISPLFSVCHTCAMKRVICCSGGRDVCLCCRPHYSEIVLACLLAHQCSGQTVHIICVLLQVKHLSRKCSDEYPKTEDGITEQVISFWFHVGVLSPQKWKGKFLVSFVSLKFLVSFVSLK